MKQGEAETWAGFILEGFVDVLIGDNPKPVAQMSKGETVGEMSYFVADTKRSATCVGASDGVMAVIPFDKIDHLLEYFEEFNAKLSKKTLNSYLKSVSNP